MTAAHRVLVLELAAVLGGCQAMQGHVGGQLPKGRFIDSVPAAHWTAGPMSVGKDRDLDLQRSSGLGLVPAPELQAYLQGILNRLVAVSPVTGVPAEARLRASEEFNALSTADADIFVDLGLIRKMDSDDQLAFVLGHELSHVLLGHTSSEAVAKTQRQLATLTEISSAAYTQVRTAHGKTGGADIAKQAHVKDQNRLLLLNTMVLSPTWTRGQEREADLLGTDLLVKAGYNPAAVDAVMAKLVEVEGAGKQVTLDSVMADLKDANWLAPEQGDSGLVAAAGMKSGSSASTSGWLNALGSKAVNYAGSKVQEMESDHPSATERRADLQRYIAGQYAVIQAPAENQQNLRQAMTQPHTKQILAHYDQAYEAWTFAQQGDLSVAEKLATASVSGQTGSHAYTRYYFSLLCERQGDTRKALQSIEVAYAAPEPALLVYRRASALREQLGDQRGAVDVLEKASREFGQPPTLMPDLIHAYRRAGRKADADRLVVECGLKYPEMKDACAADQAAGH
jgi:predicted Zn-dependent protease